MKLVQGTLLALLAVFFASSSARGQAYTATRLDIPYLFGGSSVFRVNASGQVTGSFSTRHGSIVSCCQGFLWSRTTGMIELGSLGGGYSIGYGLNDAGEVTGWAATGAPDAITGSDAFVWTQAGGMQDLGISSHGQGGINNAGQVVGTYELPLAEHAFLWSQGSGLKDLGTLGGNSSQAAAINSSGQVVGASITGGSPRYQVAFLWTETDGMQPILDPTYESFASGINDSGQIVGTFTTDQVHLNGYFWSPSGGMQDLGPEGSCCGNVFPAINSRGQVVGMRQTSDLTIVPFVWTQAAGMQDLNTLVRSNIKLTYAGSINNAGQIVGWNYSSAFLLTPKMSVELKSSINPSMVGQGAIITATVSSIAGPPPDGENITFTSGKTLLAVVPLVNGVANFNTSTLKAGGRRILARYAGDATYESCRSTVLVQTINK